MTKICRRALDIRRHLAALSLIVGSRVGAQVPVPTYVSTEAVDGRYPLAASGRASPISVSPADFSAVQRAARDLASDLTKVTGAKSTVSVDSLPHGRQVVVAGTLGKNPFIDGLVRDNKLNVSNVAGRWETFLIQNVEHPADGIDRALIVAGSDERGTIYGLYDVSAAIGVSPWTWWADVPVRRRPALYVLPGAHVDGPLVKYRGLAFVDETPALTGWAKERFGGINHKFYEKVFELVLRLKGNYFRFGSDNASTDGDKVDAKLADDYGIVVGASPDDATSLLSDDNWGNIRRLPAVADTGRPGGFGISYHFAYVGAPRSYAWINATSVSRVWEQMHLAYEHGVRRAWIANVGGIKPTEFPISFFLDYAWHPDRIPAASLPAYTRRWAAQQFGPEGATEIGEVITKTFVLAARRKPELLDTATYSLTNYREAERVVATYDSLLAAANKAGAKLTPNQHDAYYELIVFPIEAAATVNKLYVTVARNHMYAADRRASTNDLADSARRLFTKDAELTRYFDTKVAGGKWNHLMGQPHIGYTSPQAPPKNVMPRVDTVALPSRADMGVAIVEQNRPPPPRLAQVLPPFDPYTRPTYHIDVFNRGKTPFSFTAAAAQPWVEVSPAKGTIKTERRLSVSVDWKRAPVGTITVPITIAGPKGDQVLVQAPVDYPAFPKRDSVSGFIETAGLVSIDAEHFSRELGRGNVSWLRVPDLGTTASGITPMPVTAASVTPGGTSPRLDYDMFLFDSGTVQVHAYVSPTLDFNASSTGIRYAVSFDGQPPQIVSIWPDTAQQTLERAATDNILESVSSHTLGSAGQHTLKFWMVDPGVVLQRLVVSARPLPRTYLGPPESFYRWRPTKP
jgi:Gylcosyl hydrolase family 115 C-terminal domain/Glycosyl hydrolase family 115